MAVRTERKRARAWVTTPDRTSLLSECEIAPSSPSGGIASIEVLDAHTDQPMDGFGAALTDSSAWLISRLPTEKREELLRDLFHPTQGIGLSVLRVPMGASDFAVNGSYTYHDLPPGVKDPELARFTVAHDRAYILPLLRRIRQINPNVKIIASPWTAPAWMKTSRAFNGGWLDWPAYAVYARYFVKFLQAYRAAGVPVWAVTVQNEPRNENRSYPTMRMEPRDEARFIRDHLGPALEQGRLGTKIFAWDHNWDQPEYPLEVLKDPGARRYIAGVAWHAYAGEPGAQTTVRNAYPDKEVHFTESSGGEWATDFGGNLRWDIEKLIVGATRNGARTVLKWNLALDENHGPTNGGCTNCRGIVTIDSRTGAITRNEEYYALGHASRFVRPGARRIESRLTPGVPNVAFRNTDNSHVVIACNAGSAARGIRVRAKSADLTMTLPAGAVATLKW